ncbi:MAG: hypothetical protein K6E91_00700 [Butyrivibrio sp.]|nr:hypothetical protein [Butyrivibrio sp.]
MIMRQLPDDEESVLKMIKSTRYEDRDQLLSYFKGVFDVINDVDEPAPLMEIYMNSGSELMYYWNTYGFFISREEYKEIIGDGIINLDEKKQVRL